MGFEQAMRFTSAADIFDEFARSTAGRPNDQSALYHALLREQGPAAVALPGAGPAGRAALRRRPLPHAVRQGAFLAAAARMLAGERTDARFPLVLTTGRVRSQWHTRTKTGLVPQLNAHDAARTSASTRRTRPAWRCAIRNRSRSQSRRGMSAIRAPYGSTRIPPGTVFMPIHWNELFAPAASPNEATTDAADPISKQPSLKSCAVRVVAVG